MAVATVVQALAECSCALLLRDIPSLTLARHARPIRAHRDQSPARFDAGDDALLLSVLGADLQPDAVNGVEHSRYAVSKKWYAM
ncbi:MAG TPA: hypothetical protein VMM13_19215 [Euzebya sp.]|nr:hypothetical protein [Euzebya sp.]